MENWSAGYVADIGYTFGYYQELNPIRLRLAFLNAGLVFPECVNVCELGFGQGVSINIHAAASNQNYYGTDFNSSQASYAKNLANVSNSKLTLKDDSFEKFTTNDDLPDFDFIGLHGIWSWINDKNRMVLVDFLRRKLKVGGVLYISYNTLPGWTSFAPIRHLLTEHASVMGSSGEGIVSRVDGAIEYVKKLNKVNPLYLKANNQLDERFIKIEQQSREYLAHEYFNKDWHPMYFSKIADLLDTAKLEYACSANYLDDIDAINLTNEQQKFLSSITDQKFKETTKDFIINQQFRKDYWIKGKRKLNHFQQLESIRKEKIILIVNKDDVSLKVNGVLGEAAMSEQVYIPILDLLAKHQPITIFELEEALKDKKIDLKQINQAIIILAGMGYVNSVQDDGEVNEAKKNTDLLNYQLMQESRATDEIKFLASPVTGGGIRVSRFHQLFLLAYQSGKARPEEWANFVWEILSSQGQKIVIDGKTIDSIEDNIKELVLQANIFNEKKIKIFKALKII